MPFVALHAILLVAASVCFPHTYKKGMLTKIMRTKFQYIPRLEKCTLKDGIVLSLNT